MPLRLDPFQRLVDISFGNRLAVVYAYGSRPNQFIPPQVVVSLTAPVSFALIDMEAILSAAGTGSGDSPLIAEQLTSGMLSAYRAWRYQSQDVYSAGHADHVGVHCVAAINLAKFPAIPEVITVALSATGVGENFSPPEIVVSTHRNVLSIALPGEGSGNAHVDGAPVARKSVRLQEPGAVAGTINLRTLAVTLTGSNGGSGGGSGGGGQG